MIDQFLILNISGIPIFNWESEGLETDSGLISGFLSAFHTFAQTERGEEIKKISLDPTMFIFEQAQEHIFVVLTKQKDLENLIGLIIQDVKNTFLGKFEKELKTFKGDVGIFEPFKDDFEKILQTYGYFDYQNISSVYNIDEEIKCILYIERNSGDILLSKAREYIDRDALSFQAMILLKSVNRNIKEILEEESILTMIITEKFRCLIFKITEKIIIFQEKLHSFPEGLTIEEFSPKKIKKLIKKPSDLTLHFENPFIFFDKTGNVQISNDSLYKLKDELIPPDCITLINTSKNIVTQIFKEKLFGTFLVSTNSMYAAFSVNEFYVFMQVASIKSDLLSNLISKVYFCEPLAENEMTNFISIFQKIKNFKEYFI